MAIKLVEDAEDEIPIPDTNSKKFQLRVEDLIRSELDKIHKDYRKKFDIDDECFAALLNQYACKLDMWRLGDGL